MTSVRQVATNKFVESKFFYKVNFLCFLKTRVIKFSKKRNGGKLSFQLSSKQSRGRGGPSAFRCGSRDRCCASVPAQLS
jgi:hypothetical protein